MNNIKEYIKKIVDDGNIDEMYELSNMLDEVMEIIKNYDEDCYKKFEIKLYKMAYGETLSREMAEEIVSKMKPYGKEWSLEETKQFQQQYGLDDIRPVDFFIVINDKYNNNRDTAERFTNNKEEEMEMYISLTRDFIMDEDAKSGKVFKYYTIIPE